ncbi:MAG: DUF1292 domain-containing protein [Breznakia sp.]
MDSNVMFVQDETGSEVEMRILFTFDNDEKSYVVFERKHDTSGEVFASIYTDEKELLPIETDTEWQMVEEVISAFQEEEHE